MRKKITELEWRAILPRVQRRAKLGRRTQVMFNDLILTEERVERELARRSSIESRRQDFLAGRDYLWPILFSADINSIGTSNAPRIFYTISTRHCKEAYKRGGHDISH